MRVAAALAFAERLASGFLDAVGRDVSSAAVQIGFGILFGAFWAVGIARHSAAICVTRRGQSGCPDRAY